MCCDVFEYIDKKVQKNLANAYTSIKIRWFLELEYTIYLIEMIYKYINNCYLLHVAKFS